MRVLVTGGHGFIGAHVVRALAARGEQVRCLVRPGSPTDRIDDLPWEAADGDVRDTEAVRRAAQGCDAVVHLAGPSSWEDVTSAGVRAAIVGGVASVVGAVEAAGVRRLLHVSSIAALGGRARPEVLDESSPFLLRDRSLVYAHARLTAEGIVQAAVARGLDAVIVNPAEVYGPGDVRLVTARTLLDFARAWPVFVSDGGTSIVHVEDVARGIVAVLDGGRRGERYILGGENVSIRALARTTLELLGRRAPVLRIPGAALRAAAAVARLTGAPLPFPPGIVPYATRYWYVSAEKGRRELGLSFRGARETVASAVAWLREDGKLELASVPGRRTGVAAHARA